MDKIHHHHHHHRPLRQVVHSTVVLFNKIHLIVFTLSLSCFEQQKYFFTGRQVKRTLTISLMNIIDYLKNESISCYCNQGQIQISIPVCMIKSEYFMRTCLYLVRLKIFEWIKFLRKL